MKNSKLNILVVDEDVSNISYFALTALGQVSDISIHVLKAGMRRFDPLRFSRYISSYWTVKRDSDDNFVETIRNHARATSSTILMPVMENTMKFFSMREKDLQDFCMIPVVASIEILNQVTNKWKLHNWLKDRGFPVSKCILGNAHREELLQSISLMKFPILKKPVYGSGGTGIMKFDSSGEVNHYIANVSIQDRDQIIFQEYISGTDVDISALCLNGDIQYFTIQRGLQSNTLRFSTAIEFIEDENLLSLSKAIFKKLNYSGIAHLDFRLSKETGQYYLVDFNARFWSSILGSLEAGINFPMEYIKTALKEPVKIINYKKLIYRLSGEAIRSFFHFDKKGDIRKSKTIASQIKYNLRDPVPSMMSLMIRLTPR